ncbi:MAG: hypothetical protein ACXIUZ_02390 [Lysobacteraceae bacterium]
MKHLRSISCALVAGLALLAGGPAEADTPRGVWVDNDELRFSAEGRPDAVVTRGGRLFIEQVEIRTDASQQALLRALHDHIGEIGRLGQSIGEEAGGIADEVMALVADHMADLIAGRIDEATFESTVEQAAKARIAGPLDSLCGAVEAMVDTSDQVALGVPEFAPYADGHRDAGRECREGIASVQM